MVWCPRTNTRAFGNASQTEPTDTRPTRMLFAAPRLGLGAVVCNEHLRAVSLARDPACDCRVQARPRPRLEPVATPLLATLFRNPDVRAVARAVRTHGRRLAMPRLAAISGDLRQGA